jgi:hypothetical protein
MRRILLAGILLSSIVLGGTGQARALDYEEPIVPPQFLMAPPVTDVPTSNADLRILMLRSENPALINTAPTRAATVGADGAHPAYPCVPDRDEGIGGRALWNWNIC